MDRTFVHTTFVAVNRNIMPVPRTIVPSIGTGFTVTDTTRETIPRFKQVLRFKRSIQSREPVLLRHFVRFVFHHGMDSRRATDPGKRHLGSRPERSTMHTHRTALFLLERTRKKRRYRQPARLLCTDLCRFTRGLGFGKPRRTRAILISKNRSRATDIIDTFGCRLILIFESAFERTIQNINLCMSQFQSSFKP